MNKKMKLMMLKKAMMVTKVQHKMYQNQALFNIVREIKTLIRKVQTGIETDKKGSVNDAIHTVYAKAFSSQSSNAQSNDSNDSELNESNEAIESGLEKEE